MMNGILKLAGTSTSESERCMICVIEGKRMSMQSFIKLVGIGSRAHVVQDEDIIIFLTSSWVVGCKMVSRVDDSVESHAGYPWVCILL